MGQLIEQHIFGTAHLEQIMKEAIHEKLGDRFAGCLKSFQIKAWIPTTVAESIMLARDFPQGIFVVSGHLALDDSGVGMKYFEVNMEQGLTRDKDQEIADQLAFQCFACCHDMVKDRKANPNKYKLIING